MFLSTAAVAFVTALIAWVLVGIVFVYLLIVVAGTIGGAVTGHGSRLPFSEGRFDAVIVAIFTFQLAGTFALAHAIGRRFTLENRVQRWSALAFATVLSLLFGPGVFVTAQRSIAAADRRALVLQQAELDAAQKAAEDREAAIRDAGSKYPGPLMAAEQERAEATRNACRLRCVTTCENDALKDTCRTSCETRCDHDPRATP